MTLNLQHARALVEGFRGRFFFDVERGDLAYIAKDCDDRVCDCERKVNSDGDQDCSQSVGDIDDVWEPIAEMLNLVPELIAEVERLTASLVEATTERNAYRRVKEDNDNHYMMERAETMREVDSLRSQLATAVRERDEWRARYEKAHADCQEMIRLHDEVEADRDALSARIGGLL